MIFNEPYLRSAAQTALRSTLYKSASSELRNLSESASSSQTFDIFLAHAFLDADLIYALTNVLKQAGFSVYVDWMVDHHLDRSKVTRAHARQLRMRIKQSTTLLYAASPSAAESKWTPWELGFADAYHGKVAVCPIVKTEDQSFDGVEYLGLYPYIDQSSSCIWVNEIDVGFVSYKGWLKGEKPNRK